MPGSSRCHFQGLYSASKFAVEGLSEALRVEVRPFGIDVVLVQPGDFRTGFTAARRVAGEGDSPYAERAQRALAIAARDERAGADPLDSGPRDRAHHRTAESRSFAMSWGPAAQEWLMRLRHVLPADG